MIRFHCARALALAALAFGPAGLAHAQLKIGGVSVPAPRPPALPSLPTKPPALPQLPTKLPNVPTPNLPSLPKKPPALPQLPTKLPNVPTPNLPPVKFPPIKLEKKETYSTLPVEPDYPRPNKPTPKPPGQILGQTSPGIEVPSKPKPPRPLEPVVIPNAPKPPAPKPPVLPPLVVPPPKPPVQPLVIVLPPLVPLQPPAPKPPKPLDFVPPAPRPPKPLDFVPPQPQPLVIPQPQPQPQVIPQPYVIPAPTPEPVRPAPAATNTALRVTERIVNGPAARACIDLGDLIVSVNGKRVRTVAELDAALAAAKGKASIVAFDPRANKTALREVQLEGGDLGAKAEPVAVDFQEDEKDDEPTGETAVQVAEVAAKSAAARAGIQPGDVIFAVSGKRVNTPAQLAAALKAAGAEAEVQYINPVEGKAEARKLRVADGGDIGVKGKAVAVSAK